MAIVMTRNDGESWFEAAMRHARAVGLQEEVYDCIEQFMLEGDSEEEACWCALFEWDLLEFKEDEK